MSPTLNFAPPAPAEPPPASILTVVAPAAGVPSTTPNVPVFPENVSSYAAAPAHNATPKELPCVPAVLAPNSPEDA